MACYAPTVRRLALVSLLLVACSAEGAKETKKTGIDEPTEAPEPIAEAEKKAPENAPENAGPPAAEDDMPGFAVGDQATPFSLPDDSGTEVSLDQFRDKRAVLLAFYPKDFTGG